MRKHIETIGALVVVLAGASVLAQQPPAGGRCDRQCLNALVDTYLAAVVAHDPSRVTLASGAKFVENLMPLKPGEGLWKTAVSWPDHIPDLCA